MKIIHTSDLHIDSPLTQRLPEAKITERRRELLYNFERLCADARRLGADAIIIAGDLFDTERITPRARAAVISAMEDAKDTVFLYLPGNHEKDAFIDRDLPENVRVFGSDWTYFSADGVIFSGRSECAAGMFDTLHTDKKMLNVCVLHGELGSRSASGVIGASEIPGRGIDYLALGHYHGYSERMIGECRAVYSGAPEGRGFDETGEKGFSLIEIERGRLTSHFVPFAKRTVHDVEVDLGECTSTSAVSSAVEKALSACRREDIVRVRLTGRHESGLVKNVDGISMRYEDRFYHFELEDESRVAIRREDHIYDKSLKGEFIRLVLAEPGLSEKERDRIIEAGLSALLGECAEGL